MRISWNPEQSVFQAEFSQEHWSADLESVKAAGFRTFGAPEWIWYAPPPGIKALNFLREKKPESGLAITELALEKYKNLKEQYDKKEEIKAALKEAKKAAKKQFEKAAQEEENRIALECMPEKGYLDASDFPPFPFPETHKYVSPEYPSVPCFICGCKVYLDSIFKTEPLPICLWCEKEIDEQKKLENNS